MKKSLLVLIMVSCQAPITSQFTSEKVTSVMSPTSGRYNMIAPSNYSKQVAKAEKFFDLVQNDPEYTVMKFVSTLHSGDIVLAAIKASKDFTVNVNTYGLIWDKYSKVTAYHDSTGIHLNKYKLNRKECKVVNTLVHEYMHHLGYSHSSNDVQGSFRYYSVPYWTGKRAEGYCLKGLL